MATRQAGRRKRQQRGEEGFVMLVVMLVLLVATATASIAIQSTQAELRSAGQERLSVQTSYLSEVAIMTTISWMDRLGQSGQLVRMWEEWRGKSPPIMYPYAEPELIDGLTRHDAIRTSSGTHDSLSIAALQEVPMLSQPQAAPSGTGGGGAGGAGGTGGVVFTDRYGSLGADQAYVADDGWGNAYVVDIYDCLRVPVTTPGSDLSSDASSAMRLQLVCSVTARARTQAVDVINGNADQLALSRSWNFGGQVFVQSPFATAHDSRALVKTPAMMGL